MPAFLQPPYLWIVLAIVVMAIIAYVLAPSGKNWGFKDVVKNPVYWDQFEKRQQETNDRIAAARTWDAAQIHSAVTTYLFEITSSREFDAKKKILLSLEELVHPPVLRYLADRSRHAVWVKPTGKNITPESPFDRACDLLGDTPPAEALPLLVPFLDDPSEDARQQAALAIGKIGTPETIPLIRKALADSDNYVRSYALMGLSWAVKTGRLHPDCRSLLYDDVRQALLEGKNADKSARLLFSLNPEKAMEAFLSPQVFHAESKSLHYALEEISKGNRPVPRDRLLELVSSIRERDFEYPREYMMGHSLLLLGRHRHADDLELIRSYASHRDKDVAGGASQGLLAWHQLEGVDKRIWEKEESDGYDSLTLFQKYYLAAIILDGEVKNGGLEQYFVNSSGNRWRDARDGLKEMKATKHLVVLEKALAKFGKAGPSTNREQRQDQLARIVRSNEDAFEDLNSLYYDVEDSIESLANQMALANPEQFR